MEINGGHGCLLYKYKGTEGIIVDIQCEEGRISHTVYELLVFFFLFFYWFFFGYFFSLWFGVV